MPNQRNRFPARRRFLKQTAALSARAASIGTTGLLLAGTASGSERAGDDDRRQDAPRDRINPDRPLASPRGRPDRLGAAEGAGPRSSATAATGSADDARAAEPGDAPPRASRAGAAR